MKISRILPRSIAIWVLEYYLNKLEDTLDYHRGMAISLDGQVRETYEELRRLKNF